MAGSREDTPRLTWRGLVTVEGTLLVSECPVHSTMAASLQLDCVMVLVS